MERRRQWECEFLTVCGRLFNVSVKGASAEICVTTVLEGGSGWHNAECGKADRGVTNRQWR